MSRYLRIITALIFCLLAACRTTPTYEQSQTLDPLVAQEIIQKSFEQQTPGLRPINVKVSIESISLLYQDGHSRRASTIYFEDVTDLVVRHNRRYAVMIFYSLQSGSEHRKLEFDKKQSAFDFMDAINSLR